MKKIIITESQLNSLKRNLIKENENPCWEGYEQVGMKEKDGKQVPNCVPKTNENIVTENSDTYFKTLSETLDYVRGVAEKMGYTIDEDEMFTQFGTGGVSYGQTKRAHIPLLKDGKPILGKSGKPLGRGLNVIIYRMDSGSYELTLYKSW